MFQPHKVQAYLEQISAPRLSAVDALKRRIFIYGMWLLGIPAFIYGAADRGVVAFTQNSFETTTVSHCLIALTALLGWLVIGTAEYDPEWRSLQDQVSNQITDSSASDECIAEQRYRLPFPHGCQIYHLLNLKHLEEVHRFSLGNLKVTKISDFQRTQMGGVIRFKTVLDSPTNVLRMWRDPSVEVDLVLHTPYQIELKVPAYGDRYIRVMFNVIPLDESEHILAIQMFSNLQWPREILRAILTIAASVTLLEDLPYLSQLAGHSTARLQASETGTSAQAMQLFRRYVHLYGYEHKADQSVMSGNSVPPNRL